MSLSRRGLLNAFLAAPVIIRTPGLLMPVKPLPIEESSLDFLRGARSVPITTITDVEQRNREFWGLTPVTIYTNPKQTGRCIPNGTVWTNTEGTLRKGLSPLSPEQLAISGAYYAERNKRLRIFIEATHDMNGRPYPSDWKRLTPFCADRAEARRRFEVARDGLGNAA